METDLVLTDLVNNTENLIPLITIWGVRLLSALFILIAGWMIGNWIDRTIEGIRKLDDTLKTFLGGAAKYAVMAVAFVTVLGQFGVETASLLAVLGAAGLALGLALQGTLTNVASGVMLLIMRPFSVGDYIRFKDIEGTVKSLGLFGCEMATADNVYIYAPNSAIWNDEIFNYSRNTHRRQDINLRLSYGDDVDKAFKIIQKILDSEERMIRTEGKEPHAMVSNMGDTALEIIVRFWTLTSDYWDVRWILIKEIKEKLEQAGILIPHIVTMTSAPEEYLKKKSVA